MLMDGALYYTSIDIDPTMYQYDFFSEIHAKNGFEKAGVFRANKTCQQ